MSNCSAPGTISRSTTRLSKITLRAAGFSQDELMRKPLSIRLDPELEKRLERLSILTGRSVSFHANLAIREYLDDRQDYVLGIAALERNEPRISLEDLERELGLDLSGSIFEPN